MLPYDGSPGGNVLGMQFDEERRRFHDETIEALDAEWERPRGSVQVIAYLVALTIFLSVILCGFIG